MKIVIVKSPKVFGGLLRKLFGSFKIPVPVLLTRVYVFQFPCRSMVFHKAFPPYC